MVEKVPEEEKRMWEVIDPRSVVRAEPHLGSPTLTRKAKGQRVRCSEITMDGWVKLAEEPGWIATDLMGISGIREAMRPVHGQDVELGVDEPQPQGLCCLEVVYAQAAVREAPSRQARLLNFRRRGELVFTHTQNFRGWIRLANEDGWMLVSTEEHGTLLRPRRLEDVETVDLWALADAWAAVRKVRKDNPSTNDLKELTEAEESVLLVSRMDFEHHVEGGDSGVLVEDGLLTEADLKRPMSWIRQRLFANTLARMLREESPLAKVIPNFTLSHRPLPMELFMEEGVPGQVGAVDFDERSPGGSEPDEGELSELYHKGKRYLMAPDGTVFDPLTEQPVGVWNPKTREIQDISTVPVALIQIGDRAFMISPNGTIFDPETQEPLYFTGPDGVLYDAKTKQAVGVLGDPNGGPVVMESQNPWEDPGPKKRFDNEPTDSAGWAERAHSLTAQHYYYQAADAYTEALKCCETERAVELEFECELLKGRAACHRETHNFRLLMEDAERLLSYDDTDSQAQEWLELAQEGLKKGKSWR